MKISMDVGLLREKGSRLLHCLVKCEKANLVEATDAGCKIE
jgi:hypothetical protein